MVVEQYGAVQFSLGEAPYRLGSDLVSYRWAASAARNPARELGEVTLARTSKYTKMRWLMLIGQYPVSLPTCGTQNAARFYVGIQRSSLCSSDLTI